MWILLEPLEAKEEAFQWFRKYVMRQSYGRWDKESKTMQEAVHISPACISSLEEHGHRHFLCIWEDSNFLQMQISYTKFCYNELEDYVKCLDENYMSVCWYDKMNRGAAVPKRQSTQDYS